MRFYIGFVLCRLKHLNDCISFDLLFCLGFFLLILRSKTEGALFKGLFQKN